MLKIDGLKKTYAGGKVALGGVDIEIKKGEFVALLGANGAGKTTLINCLIGNTQKTSGQVSVGGHDLDENPLATKSILGVVPQEVSFDGFFSVNQVLRHQMGYFGVEPSDERIDTLLRDLGLSDKKHANTRALSGGMKRRLLIAKALVHSPELFILDEPTAGVDIELRRGLYEYLEKLHQQGVTMILTTHYLEEAERLCDRIIVIADGKIIADSPKAQLMAQLGHTVEITLKGVAGDLAAHGAVQKGENWQYHVAKTELAGWLTQVEKSGVTYADFEIKQPKLEDIFLSLVS